MAVHALKTLCKCTQLFPLWKTVSCVRMQHRILLLTLAHRNKHVTSIQSPFDAIFLCCIHTYGGRFACTCIPFKCISFRCFFYVSFLANERNKLHQFRFICVSCFTCWTKSYQKRASISHMRLYIYIYYIQRKVGSNFVCVLYFLSALPHLICQFAHNKNSQFWFIFPFCNCCCSLLLFVHMPLVAVVSASPLCWLIFFKSESCQFKATKRTFKSVFIEVAGVSTKFFENICVWFVQKGKNQQNQ